MTFSELLFHLLEETLCYILLPDFREAPSPRCNHSQALIDRNHLFIFGGSVGPSEVSAISSSSYALTDLWLLNFDLSAPDRWEWKKIKVP